MVANLNIRMRAIFVEGIRKGLLFLVESMHSINVAGKGFQKDVFNFPGTMFLIQCVTQVLR